jgi:catechol 2,3-dioxygenase-like lactoylglutathione lyase family enzyme
MMMRKSVILLATGLLATTALAQAPAPTAAPAPGRITTPEGAQMDSGADLAYKPGALTQAQLMSSTRDLFAQNSANVFRRFPREATEQMVKFYTQALSLRSLNPIQLTSTQQMLLTGVGSGQIKLSAGTQGNRKYHLEGGYKAGTGIRYFRLTYPDAAIVTKRFTDAGFAAPSFTDQGDGTKAAMVTDPGGFGIEVVIKPGAKDGSNDGVGVGISVSNLEKSRTFYREFVGLDELPAVKDKALGLTLYPYRRGETVLYLYHAGENLPQDNGSAGIQYVVSDTPMAAARGAARNIPIETPLNKLRGFDLITIWLNDPDGVTNYYAQIARKPATAAATPAATN